MKNVFSAILLALALAGSARADLVNTVIPDNDLNGLQSSTTLSGFGTSLTDVSVSLNIAGGFNGDFYAWLWHNNSMTVLLNRAGRGTSSSVGYPDPGLNVTFSDSAANGDVHWYRTVSNPGGSVLTGTWQPDGRAIDPLSSQSAFQSALRTTSLGGFNGMDPNGLWVLYVADVSPGFQGTLVSWSLNVTAVPEPAGLGLLAVGVLLWGLTKKN